MQSRRPDLSLSDPRLRVGVAIALFALVTAATCVVAYPKMFFGFAPWDDEGYFLISLESFLDTGSLYDDVYTRYGPFFYELWGGVFSFLDLPLTHDNGRMATLIAWLLAGLIIGASTYRITGSLVLGLTTQLLVFTGLNTLVYEPMHPGGLISILIALIVGISTFVGGRTAPRAMTLLGGAVAALLLVKVNVGGFALAAVALTCAAIYPAARSRGWIRPAIETGFVLIPVVLMVGKLDQSWVQDYCAHVTIAALSVVVLLRSTDSDLSRDPRELRSLVWGFSGAAILICATILATGTSLPGLVGGVITDPLEQNDAFTAALSLEQGALALDLVALLGATACSLAGHRLFSGRARWGVLVSLASIAVGIEMGLSAVGVSLLFDQAGTNFEGSQLNLLAFAWLALLPIPGAAPTAELAFSRRLIPPLAVLQALHAYPVAGSQLAWSAYLLVPVGAICVCNGVRGVARLVDRGREARTLATAGVVAAVALAFYVGDNTVRRPLEVSREAFDVATPLELPGSSRIRILPDSAQLYRDVAGTLARECDAFLSLPGLNSFYLWAEQRPPNGLNATHWMTLLSDDEQRRVIAATKSVADLCLLRNTPLVEGWLQGEPLPEGPLVAFMRNGFEPMTTFGSYELLRRRD